MNEYILQNIWEKQLFYKYDLILSDGSQLKILDRGLLNKNSGPDFIYGKVKIDDKVWFGDIEIHNNSSDWIKHKHCSDKNYDKVVLHVVWNDDKQINQNNFMIPTLNISKFIDPKFINYNMSMENKFKCEQLLKNYDLNLWDKYTKLLFKDRLFHKCDKIKELLDKNKNDWESTLFLFICKYFGSSVNKEAFYNLANSFDFKIFRNNINSLNSLEALMFGQAGFLEDTSNKDKYILSLKEEYLFIKNKYKLVPLNKEQFRFSRLRPYNFPTIKISQLCNLYYRHKYLFSNILNFLEIKNIFKILETQASQYWDTHFNFGVESKIEVKKLSTEFKNILIINSIIPVLFKYANDIKNEGLIENILDIADNMKPETNSITKKYSKYISLKNIIHSQALLELYNNYCEKNLCLDCNILRNKL